MFQSNEISKIHEYLQSCRFTKPVGSSSGHAIGEPFEKAVYSFLQSYQPQQFFKQYEVLNQILLNHPHVIGKDRALLLPKHCLRFLLNHGDLAMKNWQADQLFQEKQNDTADIIRIINPNYFGLLDVKTFNTALNGQPPNIISAYKLAELCKILIKYQEFDSLELCYLSIDWVENNNMIEAIDCHFVNLFKIDPNQLYINWAAAMQIQFHPSTVQQNYQGDKASWATAYLKKFTQSAQKRMLDMQTKFINPYLDYF